MAETSTRYIGTCAACERRIKVQDNLLVHHGYRRPGHGSIVGDCYGVHKPPHELSPEVAEGWKALAEDTRQQLQSQLKALPESESIRPSRGFDASILIKRGDPGFQKALDQRAEELKQGISHWVGEILRMERLLEHWSPMPLLTREEEKAQKRLSQAIRDKVKADKKAKKLAEKVASYQKRLDSAIRRKTFSVLIDIFRDGPSKLRDIDHTLDRQAALKLIDRSSAFSRLGLTENLDWREAYRLRELKDWPKDQAEKRE